MATKTSANKTFAKYESKDNEYNKKMAKAIKGSTRLFGAPHQFLPHNDIRVGGSTSDVSGIGKLYTEKILLEAPLVHIKPGKSKFMPGANSDMKNGMLNALSNAINNNDNEDLKTIVEAESETDDVIKYFGFTQDFPGYMKNANLLCRFMAVFLGVGDTRVPWAPHVNFSHYDWRYYNFKNTYSTESANMGANGKGIGTFISDVFESTEKAFSEDDSYITFYTDSNVSFSESGSNSTTSSVLKQYTDSLASMSKELETFGNISGFDMQGLAGSVTSSLDSFVQGLPGDGALATFMKRLTGTTNQIVQGANFLVPEIWSDSSWGTNYSIPITLATPYGNKLSWYLNIGVPLCFLLALALPHASTANTYTSPHLVQCFSQGWFNCELGIVDGISIDKGNDDCWNAAGLCNEIKVTLSVKDLYSSLTLPKSDNALGFMQNTGMFQFLLVNSGVDLSINSLSNNWNVWKFIFSDILTSKIQSAPYDVLFNFRNKVNSMGKLLK